MNFALIGHGYWGPHYGRIISHSTKHHLSWVVDTNPKKSTAITKLYLTTRFTTTIADMLKDKQVEAIIIATPSSTHYQVAKTCLENGKPCLIEKPFTTSLKDARTLECLAKKHHCQVLVGHTFVYSPALRWIKKYLTTGKLGKILFAHSTRTNFGPIRNDVDALWDIGSHEVSISQYLFGTNPNIISACGNQEFTIANLKFPQNVLFSFHVSWLEPERIRKLVIVGSQQMLIWNDAQTNHKISIFPLHRQPASPPYSKVGVPSAVLTPRLSSSEPLAQQLSAFVKAVVTHQSPLADMQHGIDVVKTITAIHHAL